MTEKTINQMANGLEWEHAALMKHIADVTASLRYIKNILVADLDSDDRADLHFAWWAGAGIDGAVKYLNDVDAMVGNLIKKKVALKRAKEVS